MQAQDQQLHDSANSVKKYNGLPPPAIRPIGRDRLVQVGIVQ